MKKSDKQYISDIDKKLAEFDRIHARTPAQLAEINKYKRIYELRDDPSIVEGEVDNSLWD